MSLFLLSVRRGSTVKAYRNKLHNKNSQRYFSKKKDTDRGTSCTLSTTEKKHIICWRYHTSQSTLKGHFKQLFAKFLPHKMMQVDENYRLYRLDQRFVLNFAIHLRMRLNIAALGDWVRLSWRLARIDKRFGFCVKEALKMFT